MVTLKVPVDCSPSACFGVDHQRLVIPSQELTDQIVNSPMTAHWNLKKLEQCIDRLEKDSTRKGGPELWFAAFMLAAGIFMFATDRASFAAPGWIFFGYSLGLLDGRRRTLRKTVDQLEKECVDSST